MSNITPERAEYLYWLDCLKNPHQPIHCLPPLQLVEKEKEK